MSKPIFCFYPNFFFDSTKNIFSEKKSLFWDINRRFHELKVLPVYLGGLVIAYMREVKQGSDLFCIENHFSYPERMRKTSVDIIFKESILIMVERWNKFIEFRI